MVRTPGNEIKTKDYVSQDIFIFLKMKSDYPIRAKVYHADAKKIIQNKSTICITSMLAYSLIEQSTKIQNNACGRKEDTTDQDPT